MCPAWYARVGNVDLLLMLKVLGSKTADTQTKGKHVGVEQPVLAES